MDNTRFITLVLAIPALILFRTAQIEADQRVLDQQQMLLENAPGPESYYDDNETIFYDPYPGFRQHPQVKTSATVII